LITLKTPNTRESPDATIKRTMPWLNPFISMKKKKSMLTICSWNQKVGKRG
jgi:hypothetical protein